MTLTNLFIIAAVAVIVIFDGVIFALRGIDATISRNLLEHSKRWPIIPFAFGVIAGHLWWPN